MKRANVSSSTERPSAKTAFWFDRDEPIQVLGLQHGSKLLGVNPLGTLNDGFRVG
jgi:hypothetical protein